MQTSPVFLWNYQSDADIVINQGGTSSGKTYAILQVLFIRAINESGVVITIAGQDMPNLRVGAIRDAQSIVAENEAIKMQVVSYNSTEKIYKFKNSSLIEFKSYDDWQDAKSGKRDYLFVNEANGIPYEVFDELQVRTRKQVFIDYNPNAAFWVHEKLVPMIKDPDATIKVVRFISNYTHNKFLDETTKRRIEAKRDDKVYWWVYGMGYTGKVKGLIFPKWEQAYKFPTDANKVAYGLDFGFSDSKCAVVKCGVYDRCLYAQVVVYELELGNAELADQMKRLGITKQDDVYADSAEPKSIAELRKHGLNVMPIKKNADSTPWSIRKMNEFDAFRVIGLDLVKEVSTYAYKKGKPPKVNDHALDATRYYILGSHGRISNKFVIR